MQYADPGGYRRVLAYISYVGMCRPKWVFLSCLGMNKSSRKLGVALKRLMKIYICAFSPSIEKASKKREQKCRVFDTIERDLPPKLHKGKVRPSLKT